MGRLVGARPLRTANGASHRSPQRTPAGQIGYTGEPMVSRFDKRRIGFAAGLYLLSTLVFFAFAGKGRLTEHTPFNHYAHLADAWLHGRMDLAHGAPAYAQGNDFAVFEGKTFISFPPFPAVLMLPWVAIAGSPEAFLDGQFIAGLAGLAPALVFLLLEALRDDGRSVRDTAENATLALLFAFGTVFFFTAVQGTVWFAAHVVGVVIAALFLLASLGGRHPLLAGLALACAWTTRPGLLLYAPFFLYEALRVPGEDHEEPGSWGQGVIAAVRRALLTRSVLAKLVVFATPVIASFAIAAFYNHARFRTWSPFAFGHEHLTVVWHERIARWGLFGYHYFAKNLGIFLTSMPWAPARNAPAGEPIFRVNEHGLALWFTTPLYFWLFAARRKQPLTWALALVALGPCLLDLSYQNSGWRQFGYRFSNDYAVPLFVLLATSRMNLRSAVVAAACAWSIAWNAWGAWSFDRMEFDRYYFREGSQSVLYQPD